MVTIYKDKVKLQVWISKDLYEELESLVKKKYDGFRGSLSTEVEQALRAWISTHKDTQGRIRIVALPNPLPRYYKVYQQVKKFIWERYRIPLDEVNQIPAKYLREAIEFVRGSDYRTIKKWINIFKKQGLIKFIGPELVELRG